MENKQIRVTFIEAKINLDLICNDTAIHRYPNDYYKYGLIIVEPYDEIIENKIYIKLINEYKLRST